MAIVYKLSDWIIASCLYLGFAVLVIGIVIGCAYIVAGIEQPVR